MSETPLTCAAIADWLDAYVDGEAAQCAGVTEQQFVDHLVACRPCLDEVLLTRRLKQLMSTRCTPAAAPETLRQTVIAQVYQTSFTSQSSWESHTVWVEQR
jgi:anti-sigma factor (TIGR02949 family)